MDDATSCAMRSVDPSGPLLAVCPLVLPLELPDKTGGVICRVLAGTLAGSCQAAGPAETFHDRWQPVQLHTIFDPKLNQVASVSCPSLCVFPDAGLASFRDATLADAPGRPKVRPLRAPPLPTVRVRVHAEPASQLPQLLQQLQLCQRYDASFKASLEETGEMVLSGPSVAKIDAVLAKLPEAVPQRPHVDYRETVTAEADGPAVWSQNGMNAVTAAAAPLPLEGEELWRWGQPRRVWAFGPTPLACDAARSVVGLDTASRDYPGFCSGLPTSVLLGLERPQTWSAIHEVEAACVAGFHWAMQTGVLAEEPTRNVQLRLLDLSLCPDAIHRGPGQMLPASRTAYYSAMAQASPRLLEPYAATSCLIPELELPACLASLDSAQLDRSSLRQHARLRVDGEWRVPVEATVRLQDAMDLPRHWCAEFHSTDWRLLDPEQTAKVCAELRERKGLLALFAPTPGGRWSPAPSWARPLET